MISQRFWAIEPKARWTVCGDATNINEQDGWDGHLDGHADIHPQKKCCRDA